jgi:hypothetical protein
MTVERTLTERELKTARCSRTSCCSNARRARSRGDRPHRRRAGAVRAVELSPFERPSRETKRELDEEAERLAAFHA